MIVNKADNEPLCTESFFVKNELPYAYNLHYLNEEGSGLNDTKINW